MSEKNRSKNAEFFPFKYKTSRVFPCDHFTNCTTSETTYNYEISSLKEFIEMECKEIHYMLNQMVCQPEETQKAINLLKAIHAKCQIEFYY